VFPLDRWERVLKISNRSLEFLKQTGENPQEKLRGVREVRGIGGEE